MPDGRLAVQVQARTLALRRRLALLLTGRFDPFPPPPAGIALSPSRAHFAAYENAPLRLAFTKADGTNPSAWQDAARSKLAELTGHRRAKAPPVARHPREDPLPGGYRRRGLYLETSPHAAIPVTLIWRGESAEPRPVMLCLQGHSSGAHLSWGEARQPADPIKAAEGLDIARQAADRGYLAVCIEQSAFGEREEREMARRSANRCFDAANHALLLGRTLLGERTSDVSAVIDWLDAGGAAMAIDLARLHAMGNSTGGEVALQAAAVDPRVTGVIASGCVGLWRETIGRREGCLDATIPGILEWLEYDDVIGLCAPRPVLTVSGIRDHIYPFAGVETAVAGARPVYEAFGAADRLRAAAGPAGHRFYPDVSWPIFLALVADQAAQDR